MKIYCTSLILSVFFMAQLVSAESGNDFLKELAAATGSEDRVISASKELFLKARMLLILA